MPLQRRKAAPRTDEQKRLDAIDREIFDGSRTVVELIADGEIVVDDPAELAAMKAVASLYRGRKAAGLKASDIAERMGVDRATISRLENGMNMNPSIETLERYAQAIGGTIEVRYVPAAASAV